MVTERASCQFERGRGHDYTRRKRTVGESLTVAAMAIQHRERSCHAFVTNRAAIAAIGEGCAVIDSRNNEPCAAYCTNARSDAVCKIAGALFDCVLLALCVCKFISFQRIV